MNKYKESRKAWKKRNPDKVKEYQKKYRKKYKEKINTYQRNYLKTHIGVRIYKKDYQKKRQKTPVAIFSHYQANARRRFILWDLSLDQFMRFWRRPCAYCGDPIETIGIDRINNQEGYFISNIVPCCTKCNKMKSLMDRDEFLNQCRKIMANYDFYTDLEDEKKHALKLNRFSPTCSGFGRIQ